jgi:predicted enzyme related to lactoylglutathione lyase
VGWNELMTPDPAAAIAFYTALFGWTTEKFPMAHADYTILKRNGEMFGGVMATPEPGAPTQWINYVMVASVDATLAQSASLGGVTIMGPMDVPDVGRIAILRDPQGALIGLHQVGEK